MRSRKRLKAEIKEISDKQQTFRDDVSTLKERQNKVLLYFGIAAVFGGAIVGAGAKIAADRLLPAPAVVGASPGQAAEQRPVAAPGAAPPQAAPSNAPAGSTGGATTLAPGTPK